MVAEVNRTIHARSRVTRGKENIRTTNLLRHKKEIYLRKYELWISIFRNKIQTRVDRCQEVLENLDCNLQQMTICYGKLREVVENSKKLLCNEKEENLQLLQLLDDCYTDKSEVSSKTQTVTPMIYGIPLKKASISLKRLDPFREQNHNISTVIADSAPAADVGFSPVATSPLRQSLEEIVNISSSSDDEESIPDLALSTYHRRCRRWHGVPNHVPPSSCEDFRLKRASIQLKRLDPRPYLSEAGNMESLNSRNRSHRSRNDSDVLESLYRVAAGETNMENESGRNESRCITPGQNCVSCRSLQPDPMVVLKRLGPFASLNDLDSHDRNTTSPSASSSVNSIQEPCQSHNRSKNVCDSRGKCKVKNLQQSANSTISVKRRKRNNGAYNTPEKQKVNCRMNTGRRCIGDEAGNSVELRRRKKKETVKKRKEVPLTPSTSDRQDEDPLEGPSWLYKDGVKKEKLRKMRRIRQGYLTPIYYLAPTIYSSTDESEDEMIENVRKTTKLRKKKKKKKKN